jgi:thiol-disulfide isomerase/thioredoxin
LIFTHIITKSLILLSFFLFLLTSCTKPADFYLIDGQPVHLEQFSEQYIVINYWAEWCKPCLEEVPELNDFHTEHQTQYPLFALSYDKDTNEQLLQQKQKYQMRYPMISSQPLPKLGIEPPSMLPANYIRAPSGKIYGPLLGPQTKDALLAAIAQAKAAEQGTGQ